MGFTWPETCRLWQRQGTHRCRTPRILVLLREPGGVDLPAQAVEASEAHGQRVSNIGINPVVRGRLEHGLVRVNTDDAHP